MRLNWFSPLPPAPTGVAEFTAGILPELAERFDLTLWTGTREHDLALEKQAAIRFFPDFRVNDQDPDVVNVFNIGNNRAFHERILQISRKHSGIIILHDLELPNLRARFFFARRVDPLQVALARAIGVMVHSRPALEMVKKKARCPVRLQPLPYRTSTTAPAKRQDRHKLVRLIIFGFLGTNRSVETVLRALQSYPRRSGLRLDIYGKVFKLQDFRRLVEKLELTDMVTFHGFVSSNELDEALDRADLAINLRHPTMGEASGSQLKIWDHALPSLVTPIGSYVDLPPGTVGYVNLETEIADLHRHFDALQNDPKLYCRMGEEGRAALLSNRIGHRPDPPPRSRGAIVVRGIRTAP